MIGWYRTVTACAAWLRALPASLPEPPRALLVVSAHWEEPLPTLTTGARPPLLFDYYGFPPHTYELAWPAPGAPELAARVGYVVQDPELGFMADTVREEVELGLPAAARPWAGELAERLGLPLADFGERNPYRLSGGAQRRLSLGPARGRRPARPEHPRRPILKTIRG